MELTMRILAKHPIVLFATGIAVGFYAHKYRKELIESAEHLSDLGKGLVMHQADGDITVETAVGLTPSKRAKKT